MGISKFTFVSENDRYSWCEFPVDAAHCNILRLLQPFFQKVTYKSFQSRTVSFSQEDLEKTIYHSTNFFLLQNSKDGVIIGFAFIYVTPFSATDEKLCFINKIAISSEFQGKHFASQFRKLLLEKGFVWIAARTQNPAIMYNFSKKATKVYPFNEPYSGNDDGKKVLEFIVQNVPQVKDSTKTDFGDFDISTGIYKGFYGCNLGNNYINKSENFVNETAQLDNWNFNATNGDALLITSSFKTTK